MAASHCSCLWVRAPNEREAPLLPVPKKKKLGRGRPRASDRAALEAIIFVLRTGILWEMLLARQFGLSGMTAWRRRVLLSSTERACPWPRA
ncbi:transposase [Hyalangium versicolor]|uniref:transposase n=1 Tax=Hyalangium versicolor TaxID=2861190 RepID=UPI00359F7835